MIKERKIGIILGPNGSGKGTLAERICARYEFGYLNMGESIREWVARDAEGRNDVLQELNTGNLIGDDLVQEIFINKIAETHAEHDRNLVLDGIPRRMTQVEFVVHMCEVYNYSVGWIIALNVPLEAILERISQRVIGPDGKVYNLKYNPPPKEFSKEQLTQRNDDKPDVVEHRYAQYMSDTLECLTHPLFRGVKIENIDATQSIDEVYEQAIMFLNERD